MRLENKTAIITGAASGMGEAMAKLYAKEGANVVIADINVEAINDVLKEIHEQGGSAIGVKANIADENDIVHLVKETVNHFGSLDILVNNAGIMDNFNTAGDVTNELWEKIIAVNLTGPFKLMRESIRVMNDQDNGGVIINNASVGGLFGSRGGAAYVASKHALIGLTKNIAATYGTYGKIRANAIAPGGVYTAILNSIKDPHELGFKALQDAGYSPMADPSLIAEVALFLASDSSAFVNGDVITADGGWTAR